MVDEDERVVGVAEEASGALLPDETTPGAIGDVDGVRSLSSGAGESRSDPNELSSESEVTLGLLLLSRLMPGSVMETVGMSR
jgi:hypothetical protein